MSRLILVAEDDEDDFFLTREALLETGCPHRLERVSHGVQLMTRLREPGAERPAVLLLDLNMPRKDGREALLEIRSDPALADLPVLIFTTSRSEDDRALCAARRADAFLRKPDSYDGLLTMLADICARWLPVEAPSEPEP